MTISDTLNIMLMGNGLDGIIVGPVLYLSTLFYFLPLSWPKNFIVIFSVFFYWCNIYPTVKKVN